MSTTPPPPGQPEPPQQPGAAPPPPAATPPGQGAQPPATTGAGGEGVTLDLNAPLEIANWRALLHGLMVIPYAIANAVIQYVAQIWAFFIVLITAEMPENAGNFFAMSLRTNWRSTTYMMFMREDYPPFEFDTVAQDPGGDPATLSVNWTPGPRERFAPIIRFFQGIMHVIYAIGRGIVVWVYYIINFFMVLFTGKWNPEHRQYIIDFARWYSNLYAWIFTVTNTKPPLEMR